MEADATTSTVLEVPDIVCDGCATAIRTALGRLPGVASVDVDVPRKTVAVAHGPAVSRDAIVAALERAGYSVE